MGKGEQFRIDLVKQSWGRTGEKLTRDQEGVEKRKKKETYAVAVGKNDAVLDINVHVAVGNVHSVDKLADIDMGNTGARVGIGILPDVELSVGTELVAYEMTRKVHGGSITGGKKVGFELNLVRAGLEHLVGMFWTETESLSTLNGIHASGKDAGDDERGNKEAAHNEEGGKGNEP